MKANGNVLSVTIKKDDLEALPSTSGEHFRIIKEEVILNEDEPEVCIKPEPCEKGSLFIFDGLVDIKKEEEPMIMGDSTRKNDIEIEQDHTETEKDPISTNSDQVPESNKAQTIPTIHQPRKLPVRKEPAGPSVTETLNTLNELLLQQGKKHQHQEDECDMYGKMIAKKLRKLPDYERLRFMHEIDGMFIRHLSGNMPVFVCEPPNSTALQVHQAVV